MTAIFSCLLIREKSTTSGQLKARARATARATATAKPRATATEPEAEPEPQSEPESEPEPEPGLQPNFDIESKSTTSRRICCHSNGKRTLLPDVAGVAFPVSAF